MLFYWFFFLDTLKVFIPYEDVFTCFPSTATNQSIKVKLYPLSWQHENIFTVKLVYHKHEHGARVHVTPSSIVHFHVINNLIRKKYMCVIFLFIVLFMPSFTHFNDNSLALIHYDSYFHVSIFNLVISILFFLSINGAFIGNIKNGKFFHNSISVSYFMIYCFKVKKKMEKKSIKLLKRAMNFTGTAKKSINKWIIER